MENASQALLIAGGILLAILVLSTVVYMMGNISQWGQAQDSEKEAKKIAAWNAEWEAYNKKLLYGAEVLTVVNKANQNNLDYDGNSEYTIEIKLEGMNSNGENITKNNLILYKKSIFECTSIGYNKETGRVNYIEFKLIEDLM